MDIIYKFLKKYTSHEVTDVKTVKEQYFSYSHLDLVKGKKYLFVARENDAIERLIITNKFEEYCPTYPGAYGDLGEGYTFENDTDICETISEYDYNDKKFFELNGDFCYEDLHKFINEEWEWTFCEDEDIEKVDGSIYMFKLKNRAIFSHDDERDDFYDWEMNPLFQRIKVPDDFNGSLNDICKYLIRCKSKN